MSSKELLSNRNDCPGLTEVIISRRLLCSGTLLLGQICGSILSAAVSHGNGDRLESFSVFDHDDDHDDNHDDDHASHPGSMMLRSNRFGRLLSLLTFMCPASVRAVQGMRRSVQ